MRRSLLTLDRRSRTPSPVAISGDRGTGWQYVASTGAGARISESAQNSKLMSREEFEPATCRPRTAPHSLPFDEGRSASSRRRATRHHFGSRFTPAGT
jgi:hypothetical protein